MYPNPQHDRRKWRLYDTHRFPINTKSPHHYLPEQEKQLVSRMVQIFITCPQHEEILFWGNSVTQIFWENTDFLNYYDLSYENLETFEKIISTCRKDSINFIRFDLVELAPEKLEAYKVSAYTASVEHHLFEIFLNKNILAQAKEQGFFRDRCTTS